MLYIWTPLGRRHRAPQRRRAAWESSTSVVLTRSRESSTRRTQTSASGSATSWASVSDTLPAYGSAPEPTLPARPSIARMLPSPTFWAQRSLHPVARLVLLLIVGVLLVIAVGFVVANGGLTRHDLLAVTFYAGLAAFAWHPMTAAFIVMLISSAGVVFTGSGGDLLELAMAIGLVAATCAPWVVTCTRRCCRVEDLHRRHRLDSRIRRHLRHRRHRRDLVPHGCGVPARGRS